MGAENAAQARGVLFEATKKGLSIISLRSHAKLLLSRARLHLEKGYVAAADRQDRSREKWENLQWGYYNRKGPQIFV